MAAPDQPEKQPPAKDIVPLRESVNHERQRNDGRTVDTTTRVQRVDPPPKRGDSDDNRNRS